MRFTITPLGGAGSTVGQVVDRIVRYLRPQPPPPLPTTAPGGPDGPSRYYADSGEEPGRWLGRAASAAGLHGEVQPDDFAGVLAGRDPRTGERLITAQGSAGRRPQLGTGNPTKVGADGERLYGEADAAAALGVTKAEVSRMLDVGTGIALSRLAPGPGRVPGSIPGGTPGSVFVQVVGSYLVPVIDEDGSRWVTEDELARCEATRAAGIDPTAISSAVTPDQFPISEAARLAGVTAQYMRKLASRYEDHHAEIGAAGETGRQPRRAYLVAYRGSRGQWIVTREDLVELLERRRPPAVRVGFDLTLTTEKSLGVLALLGDADTRRTVLDAIQRGNDWALAWLEEHAAVARVDGDQVKATGWTVASFRHLTSRALDPFPHHHNVVANTVTLPDGSRRALDARGLYQRAQAASALATAEMRHQLTAGLGVRWRPGRKGSWEIAGIDDQVLSEFSQRRKEINDALRELEEEIGRGAHPSEVENIVLRTRPAKNHTPAADLVDGWRARAAAHGLDTRALAACQGHDALLAEPDTETLFASLAAPNGICAGGSVFSRADALVALANHPVLEAEGEPQPLLVGAARLEALTDQFLASSHVVHIAGSEDGLFTTAEMLGVQDRIMSRFRGGLHRGASLVPDPIVAATLDRHPHLTGEQRALAESWCGSGHRFQTAIGRAGTGKTTTVAAAAEAWTAAGHRVLGAAVKGEAARTLAATTGIGCETVAWYLAHDDPHTAPLDARTVLVVDEASTLSDRDLNQLMWMAATTGATLRLIGDPAQHGAIAAGGMFRVLCERHRRHTPELTVTHRVQDPHDRAAAEMLRSGHIDQALDHMAAAGHLHIVGDDLAMYRQVLARWWDSHRAALDHPMVDRRNSTRRQLNRLAHLLRQIHDEIGTDEILASGDRRFSVGDRVTARAPNRDLHPPGDGTAYVRNGALGTISAIDHDKRSRERDTITVDFDGVGAIRIPRSFFDHHRTRAGRTEVGIDHAYALTSYAVQGSTRDVSTSRVDATATRAEAYVDITRGRLANHLYLTAATDPLDGEALPKVPDPPADDAVAARLQRSTGELTAWELAHAADTPPRGQAIGL
jgi:conjugative relaxase-like TrwC/TraI family protein